ncbi:polyprenyl diphosphate synthase [Wukongibacter baidiensis]|uniref:polyprenyl diphosphate synthase n=1 Tax=Wukongibacter baidiensis TaxID=1723361 RepID=UPI003D7F26BE
MNHIKENLDKVPKHVAIICDGNGRWATKRGLPRSLGHREGAKTAKEIVEVCKECGVEYLTLYLFSTENWNRPKEEVDYLMNLFVQFFRDWRYEAINQNIKIVHIGSYDNLSEKLIKEIRECEESTMHNSGMVLNLALNYGGRFEIVESVKSIVNEIRKGSIEVEQITEEVIDDYLYTKDQPNPDLLIRTSDEWRFSNFLLWQISKSKIWVSEVQFPDFKRDDLLKAFTYYN